jgi:geranylgeranyl diphosphate synthase type I
MAVAPWLGDLVAQIDARLRAVFAEAAERARATSPRAHELAEAVAELTLRGGKRLRPAALFASMRAVDEDAPIERALDASVALELLQSYLLIQDDWMDDDLERRGGPSVHAVLRRQVGNERLGDSLAILAGDLAAGMAWELLAAAPFPRGRAREALKAFGEMHWEVVLGQQLDLVGHADVGLTHRLKTGSYTVRGPMQLGALLGDATAAQLDALQHFADPLGVAFQVRDDLLGSFGRRGDVGKPIGADLRAGKRTALIAEAQSLLSEADGALLDRVLGNASAPDEDVERATDALLRSGVRERLEARIDALASEANAALASASLSEQGRTMLGELVELLVHRDR